MNCLECNSPTRVVDSRKKGGVAVVRRHGCRSCGYRFTTVEVSLYDFERLFKKKDMVSREIVELIENPELF